MSIELIKENHKGKKYKTPICKILHRYKGTVAGENKINKYETIYLISGTADISIQEETKRFHAPARFIIPKTPIIKFLL